MSQTKVAEDQAIAEFEKFLEAMDLDFNVEKMDENDRNDFQKSKDTIVRELIRGRIVFDDKHQPIFTPVSLGPDCEPIIFHEPEGSHFMEMDRKKQGHDVGKMHAIMAGITKRPAKIFAQMKYRDYRVCQNIVTLFLV